MCSSLMSSWSFSIARMVIDRCCRVDGPPLSTLLNDDAISQRALATSEMVAGPKMQLFLAEVCLSGEAACLQLLDSFQDGRGGLGLCITYYMMLSGENYRCEHTQSSLKDCSALPGSHARTGYRIGRGAHGEFEPSESITPACAGYPRANQEVLRIAGHAGGDAHQFRIAVFCAANDREHFTEPDRSFAQRNAARQPNRVSWHGGIEE